MNVASSAIEGLQAAPGTEEIARHYLRMASLNQSATTDIAKSVDNLDTALLNRGTNKIGLATEEMKAGTAALNTLCQR